MSTPRMLGSAHIHAVACRIDFFSRQPPIKFATCGRTIVRTAAFPRRQSSYWFEWDTAWRSTPLAVLYTAYG